MTTKVEVATLPDCTAFAAAVGERFEVSGGAINLILAEAKALQAANRPEGMPAPFALLFHGPVEAPLAQGLVRVSHDRVGTHDIFLVPVGRDDRGYSYEAIFA